MLVFDGARLKMKERVELERARQRQEARERALLIAQSGNLNGAVKKFVEGVEISNEMI